MQPMRCTSNVAQRAHRTTEVLVASVSLLTESGDAHVNDYVTSLAGSFGLDCPAGLWIAELARRTAWAM